MKSSIRPLPPLRPAKLPDQVRERVRYLHYSTRMEQVYVHWVRAFMHQGKGGKDWVVMLPESLVPALRELARAYGDVPEAA